MELFQNNCIKLLQDITRESKTFRKGMIGTVVHIYSKNIAYVIEFCDYVCNTSHLLTLKDEELEQYAERVP